MGISTSDEAGTSCSSRRGRFDLSDAAARVATASCRYDRSSPYARRASSSFSMTLLDRAVHEISSVLESLHIPYMVIGGIANAIWGEPRATVDVDVTVSVSE